LCVLDGLSQQVIPSCDSDWRKSRNINIRMRNWRWFGHNLRKDDESIGKQTLDWDPQGARKRGRPKKTWIRTVLE